MSLTNTPVCNYGIPAIDFKLQDSYGKWWTLEDCRGERGTLVMFICNHCPYVKAIQGRLAKDTRKLSQHGIKSVAIMPNDTTQYPEDSLENMQKIAAKFDYPFPYLLDRKQDIARAYEAVCTPDFFGYNAKLELQYRGRIDSSGMNERDSSTILELHGAMLQIVETGIGPEQQHPSMGCSIKWKENHA